MAEIDDLKKIIDDNDIISFDIFDTLLLRNVMKPSDIFTIIENKVVDKYDIKDFKKNRMFAEEKSRKEVNNYETTLKEIYENIDILDEKILEDIKQIELETEKEFLTANPFMQEVYNYCCKKNKKVICITDMYLPKYFIEKVLDINGYKNIKIYLSCDHKKTKSSGKLYEEVFQKEKFNKAKWLHIGDNIYSDFDSAKNFGINAYHYVKIAERQKLKVEFKNLFSNIVWAVSNNLVNNGLCMEERKYFELFYLAPIFYIFAYFIFKNRNEKSIIYLNDKLSIIEDILHLMEIQENAKLNIKKFNNNEVIESKNIIDIVDIAENKNLKLNSKNLNYFYLISKKKILNFNFKKNNLVLMKVSEYERFYNIFSSNINYKQDILNVANKFIKYLNYMNNDEKDEILDLYSKEIIKEINIKQINE